MVELPLRGPRPVVKRLPQSSPNATDKLQEFNNMPAIDEDAILLALNRILGSLQELHQEVDQKFDEVGRKLDEMGRKVYETGRKVDKLGRKVDGTGQKPNVIEAGLDGVDKKPTIMDHKIDTLSLQMLAMNQNNVARTQNTFLRTWNDPLTPLVNPMTSAPIPGFPAASREIRDMTRDTLCAILEQLGLPSTGDKLDLVRRLRENIGLRREPQYDDYDD